MKINLSSTCGNSPKNTFVQDYTVKLLSFDFDQLASMSTDGIEIVIPDKGSIKGKQHLTDLKNYFMEDIAVLTIDSSISHGKYGAALCEISNSEESYKISFDYTFNNLKAELIKDVIILIVKKKK
ncbi:hypothetical protein CAR_c01270 [Carnobacterium sp. 17-4]|uniref:hypothetical protein n=1 Tax=Carnobacterium sp. (strain 17-4) TaxID=208596 RepID=UPI00020589C0|nr:hypothetical protein [Carnobacterium sp. 17-4]AEB28878.1 hypothetical protein CAR_c01270 [Carnobacterium sp. 17-4]